MEHSPPPAKKIRTYGRPKQAVEYKNFSLPHKYPGKVATTDAAKPSAITIANPIGARMNIPANGYSTLRIKGKDGTDFGEAKAMFLNVKEFNGKLLNKPVPIDKKSNVLTFNVPKGAFTMLIPVPKQNAKQLLPKNNSTVATVPKPVSSRTNEKPEQLNKYNKINELNAAGNNKSSEKPGQDLARNESSNGCRIMERSVPLITGEKIGITKQKIQYFDLNKHMSNGKPKETGKEKKLPGTNKENTVTHDSPNALKRIVSKSSIDKKEFVGEGNKSMKNVKGVKTIILKGTNPGKSTTPTKLVRLVKFKNSPLPAASSSTTSESSTFNVSSIKLPTLKLDQNIKNRLFMLSKSTDAPADSDTSSKAIVPDQDVSKNNNNNNININNNNNNNNAKRTSIDSVSNLMPAALKTEEKIEDRVSVEVAEDDVEFLYEKKAEDPLSSFNNDLNNEINMSNGSPQHDTRSVNNSKFIAKVEEPAPRDNERRPSHTSIPLANDENIIKIALLALAECGTNKMQQIKNNCAAVVPQRKELQTQTDVFGLLDGESFVSVNEARGDLKRIKPTEFPPAPVTREVQAQTEPEHLEPQPQPMMPSVDYTLDNVDLIATWNVSSTLDLDEAHNFFQTSFVSNQEVDKVKKVLSIPQTFCKKVTMQLERDYEGMQSWDDNGFLNIHRAVINNDLTQVKRLLLVLKASKTNIDIRTEEGLTSLELAIKHESSESIVKLLLDAGAQPITSELLHESAVILASKYSSPLLPLLLDYVTDCELLNQVDSTGFAPLHYCAMNGTVDGLNALISKDVDVNLRDHRSGRTPFFHAVENNHARIAQRLIQSGAIADIPNFSGQSVMSLVDDAKGLSLMPILRDVIFQLPASFGSSNF